MNEEKKPEEKIQEEELQEVELPEEIELEDLERPEPEEGKIQELNKIIVDLLSLPFSFLAINRKNPRMELTPEEKKQLATVTLPVIKKYYTITQLKYAPEIMFILFYYSLYRKKIHAEQGNSGTG